jgi:hypothetical protein
MQLGIDSNNGNSFREKKVNRKEKKGEYNNRKG